MPSHVAAPRPRFRPLSLGATALGACLLLTSCSDTASSSSDPTPTATKSTSTQAPPKSSTTTSTSTPTAVAPPAPVVGECRNMTYEQTQTLDDSSPTVPCRRPHTAVTIAVETLPERVNIDGITIDNRTIQSAAAKACRRAFVAEIGGDANDRAESRFTHTYFVPDQKGFDAGARWVRCDAVALQAEDRLAKLPREVDGILDDDQASRDFMTCSRGEPGTSESVLVTCAQSHDFRVVEAISLGSKAAEYPGASGVRGDGRAECREVVEDLLDTSGGFTFTWTYPTKADWNEGHRFGYCWLAA